MELKIIAHIHTAFNEKFGIPRQSGLSPDLGKIVFEPEYRVSDALKGIEGYSHLWLIWQFSKNEKTCWSPTVRPPRLGGNRRMGVFATRSPFRPNSLGLSSVELVGTKHDSELGDVLIVKGADMADGTPIFDIKPYLAYTDSHPEAASGFAGEVMDYSLKVEIAPALLKKIPAEQRECINAVLANDPRPSYHNDESRIYGMSYAGLEIKFVVKSDVLEVIDVQKNSYTNQ